MGNSGASVPLTFHTHYFLICKKEFALHQPLNVHWFHHQTEHLVQGVAAEGTWGRGCLTEDLQLGHDGNG